MKKFIVDLFVNLISGGVGGVILGWLLKNWFAERLKQSIQLEFSQKLENYKADLNTKIQVLQHENQLQQLRTSLFFDHQRNAFAELIAKIAEINLIWIDVGYEPEIGFTESVPSIEHDELKKLYYKHQLFLDTSCLATIELIFDYYRDSFPFDDGSGKLRYGNIGAAYDAIEYLQPRLTEIFQSRIGISVSGYAEREIALLGSIRLVNNVSFKEINLPVSSPLKLKYNDSVAEAVQKAEENFNELMTNLKNLQAYLKEDGGFFHTAATKTARYLMMLNQ